MATILEALTLALDLHLAGRFGEAQELYTRILDAEPEQPDALHYLGVLAGQVGRGEFGLTLIDKALALRPEAADIHANRANLLRGLDRLGEAEAGYRRALALRPDFAEAWTDRAFARHSRGDAAAVDAAAELLERALRIEPTLEPAREKLTDLLHARGRLRLESGKVTPALADLIRAAALDPRDADIAFLLGNALFAAGLRADSVIAFRNALALAPDFLSAALNLGIALAATNRAAAALAPLRHAVRIDPAHPAPRDTLALALRALGRGEEADALAQPQPAPPQPTPAPKPPSPRRPRRPR
ncbi:tetratricopeptide repeat protein (plasmid) [Azospirillum oryzae]|uniref:Tetratricopeptide repeat protein n=2 Tax=Azospirillum oryzae TaxID=286727 RepID=A0A6N1AR17_9PROT|nr:tetratricopeptide repeat protein [Azospirillum oryzae]KAA0585186.1 tetratricopeptide repeat protein [Azospirillum oryzae]QKS53688.1 tetratricopeptide repeat protein [Azospirillum oryzae]